MMKKLVLGVTVAALVGVSSSCFAGFGVPKMPGAKAEKPAATSSAESNVDIDGITTKQALVLVPVAAAYTEMDTAYTVLGKILENPKDNNLDGIATAASIKQNVVNKDIQATSKNIDTNAKNLVKKAEALNVLEEDKQNVANALEFARAHRRIAEKYKLFAAATAVPMGAEASKAVKSVGKDMNKLNKLNGVVATFKLYEALDSKIKIYDEAIRVLKTKVGEATPDAKQKADGLVDGQNTSNLF